MVIYILDFTGNREANQALELGLPITILMNEELRPPKGKAVGT